MLGEHNVNGITVRVEADTSPINKLRWRRAIEIMADLARYRAQEREPHSTHVL